MDFDEQFNLEHILFQERICRSCGITKNLIDSFYRIRKNKGSISSSYAYECKECTISRIKINRKKKYIKKIFEWEYPDW